VVCCAIDDPVRHGDEECEQDAEEHAEHDEIGAMRVGVPHHEPTEHAARQEQHAQRQQSSAAVFLAKTDGVGRQARRRLGKDQRDKESVKRIETGEHQARNEGAFIHVADRLAELVGHHDQHQRRRNDLRQRP